MLLTATTTSVLLVDIFIISLWQWCC